MSQRRTRSQKPNSSRASQSIIINDDGQKLPKTRTSQRFNSEVQSQPVGRQRSSAQKKSRSQSQGFPQYSQTVGANDDRKTSRKSQSSQRLSSEIENQLVGSVIKYLLAVDRSKRVIHRQHLMKNVFVNYPRQYADIMSLVEHTLSEVFGFNLVEFESGKYLLTNAIPNDTPHLLCPADEQPHRILVVLVLTHIFMSDGKCTEASLWSFLRRMTIIPEDNFNSNYFGDVKKLITVEFVKQQYIELQKVGSSVESPVHELQWGPRAEVEVSRRYILEFVSKMYNDRPLTTWPKQLNAIEETKRLEKQPEHNDSPQSQ